MSSVLARAGAARVRHRQSRRRAAQQFSSGLPASQGVVMSANQVALAYLVASVLFILALKGLSHPETARRGNLFGIVGMLIAVLTTLALTRSIVLIVAAIA